MSVKIRNRLLALIFPWLYPKNVWSGDKPDDYDYSYLTIEPDEDGWMKSWFYQMNWEMLLSFIQDKIKDILSNKEDKFKIKSVIVQQYKEKFGTMRLYMNYEPQCIRDYEAISANTCHRCGRPDVPMLDIGGYFLPLCEKCFDDIGWRFHNDTTYESCRCDKDEGRIPDEHTATRYSKDGKEVIGYPIKKKADKIRRRWNRKHPDDKAVIM